MKTKFLQFQLILLILSSLFSFGGTNEIDFYASGHNIMLQRIKGISLFLPVFFYLLIILIQPNQLKIIKSIFKNNIPLLCYISWALLSIMWSVNSSYSLNKISIFFMFIFSASCLLSQYSYYYKDNVIEKIYTHIFTVFSIIAIIIFLLWMYYGMQSGRATRMNFGPYSHANQIASFAGILLFHFLFYKKNIETNLIEFSPKMSLITKILILLMIFIVIVSFSRAVFFSILLALLFSYLFMKIRQYEKSKSFQKIFFIFVIINLSFLALFFQNEVIALLARDQRESLLLSRTIIWNQTLNGLTESSIIKGWGYGLLSKHGLVQLKWVSINGAHNIFLQVLAGTGIVGLAMVLFFFISIFKTMWKSYLKSNSTQPAFTIGIVVFFVCNGFSENLFGIGISASFLCLYFFYNIEALSLNKTTEPSEPSKL